MAEQEVDGLSVHDQGEEVQAALTPNKPARHALLMGIGLAAWVIANVGMRVLSPIQESLAARAAAGDQRATALALLALIPGILSIVFYVGGLLLVGIGAVLFFRRGREGAR